MCGGHEPHLILNYMHFVFRSLDYYIIFAFIKVFFIYYNIFYINYQYDILELIKNKI